MGLRITRRGVVVALVAVLVAGGLLAAIGTRIAKRLGTGGTLTTVFAVLIFVVLFVLAMQTALNVPVWVCLSELFPLRLRDFSMGLSVLVLWLTNALVAGGAQR